MSFPSQSGNSHGTFGHNTELFGRAIGGGLCPFAESNAPCPPPSLTSPLAAGAKMKSLRLIWDFLFGALLIGGAPMCVMALTVVLADFCQALLQVVIPEGVSLAIFVLMSLTSIAAFAYAIRFRLRRRLLPKAVILAEVVLGAVGAFSLFSFYGVVIYSSIG
jgi:hypothetical protein